MTEKQIKHLIIYRARKKVFKILSKITKNNFIKWKWYSSYNEYINSDLWKERKKKFISSENHNYCKVCGSKEKLNVHHIDYSKMWNEPNSHLVTLCNFHHIWFHKMFWMNIKRTKSYIRNQRKLLNNLQI